MIDSAHLHIDSDRLLTDFNELAEIGATVDGGVSRLALSNEDLEARAWLADRFIDAGLGVRDDDAGNLSGVLHSDLPDAKTLLIGSHLDSVPNGGRYDSSVGAIAGLECLRTIREAEIKLPVHVEVIDFTDEEGCWQSLFGSRALTSNLDQTFLSDSDGDYGPFRAALFRAGIRPVDVYKARRDPATVMGYLELDIEQGHRLDREGVDIGVVTGIIGRTTYLLTFHGEASHSGTTAMGERRDALLGASIYVCSAHHFTRDNFPEGVFNCGNLEVSPGAFNIIPSEARLTMECRHPDKAMLEEMEQALIQLAEDEADNHDLTLTVRRATHMPAATLTPQVVDAVEEACEHVEASHQRLISYAGHDAQFMSGFTNTGMIFVPSVGGISHSPKEYTEWRHIVLGTNVLLHTILRIAQDAG